MNPRLQDLPIYSSARALLPAPRFNLARLALLRLGNPQVMELPGLKNLALIIDQDAWICIDRSLNEIPVIAWTEFDVHARGALHEPIACRVLHYHAHAEKIVEKLFENMDVLLAQRLKTK